VSEKYTLQMVSHISFTNCHILVQEVVGHGILKETNTPMDKHGYPSKTKKPRVVWYRSNEPENYDSFKECLERKKNDSDSKH
jgi:hypothetical protein